MSDTRYVDEFSSSVIEFQQELDSLFSDYESN